MTGAQVERLLRRFFVPELDGYAARKRLLYREPVGDILAGFFFDATRYGRLELDVQPFVQLLYVPETIFHFTAVDWLDGPQKRDFRLDSQTDEAGIRAMLSFVRAHQGWVERFQDVHKVIDKLAGTRDVRSDCLALQLLAHSRALVGDLTGAIATIDRLSTLCAGPDESWFAEGLGRTLELRRVITTAPDDTAALLDSWRQSTLEAIGLA